MAAASSPSRMPVQRPDNFALETPQVSPRVSWGSEKPEVTLAKLAPRPDNFALATPRTSLASSVSPRTPREGTSNNLKAPTPRPAHHPIATPRTSYGSAGWRLSLGSAGSRAPWVSDSSGGRKCSQKQMLVVLAVIATLLCAIAGIVVYLSMQHASPMPSSPMPIGPCSDLQIVHGCAAGFCSASGECQCIPNYDQLSASTCAEPLSQHRMLFHVYRALGDANEDGDNSAGSATVFSMSGIMWHLHNSIVNKSCPRSFNVTRIVRLKATVFNTDKPFEQWKGQFGPFEHYVHGNCTSPDCAETQKRYGSVVGCLPWSEFMGGHSYGNTSQFYSLPGFNGQGIGQSGGQCDNPNGTDSCTWDLQPAGEVRLDMLEGISNYQSFCAAGGVEYFGPKDAGNGCSFWDNQSTVLANARRVTQLQQLFEHLYPNTALPEPTCDSQNAECHYHEGCQGLSGKCCPAENGEMLACCGPPPTLKQTRLILA